MPAALSGGDPVALIPVVFSTGLFRIECLHERVQFCEGHPWGEAAIPYVAASAEEQNRDKYQGNQEDVTLFHIAESNTWGISSR